MRISTAQVFQQQLSALQNRQSKLLEAEMQITSGLRVMKPSDDPSAAVQILNLDSNIGVLDQYGRNAALAESALALEENALKSVNDGLQRLRELTLQANNASYSGNDRASIAREIRQIEKQLLALANTRDAAGDYIFAGFRGDTPPFVKVAGAVQYAGDAGQRFLAIGEGAAVATGDSGQYVFQEIRGGNGRIQVSADTGNTGTGLVGDYGLSGAFERGRYTIAFSRTSADAPLLYSVTDDAAPPTVVTAGEYREGEGISFAGAFIELSGQPSDGDNFVLEPAANTDLFGMASGLADAMERAAPNAAARTRFHNDMARGLANLDRALEHVNNRRAEVGARLNNIDAMREVNEDFKLQLDTTLSQTRDLDYAEAITRFNQHLTSLQAAQQVFVKTSSLSLFQYL